MLLCRILVCNVAHRIELGITPAHASRCNSVSWGCHCATGLGNLMELIWQLLATCWKLPNLIAKGKIAEVLANSIASGYLKWNGMTLRYECSYVVCRLLKLVHSGIMHDLSLTFVILHHVNITYYYHINRSIVVLYIILTYYHSVIYQYNILLVITYQLSGIYLSLHHLWLSPLAFQVASASWRLRWRLLRSDDGTIGIWPFGTYEVGAISAKFICN